MNAPHDPSPELAAWLRLKRHEQPPPGYYDEFAHAFRERQRAELLRVSTWQLLVDRVGTHFHEWRSLTQPRWAIPAAAASLLALGWLLGSGLTLSTPEVARTPGAAPAGSVRAAVVAPGAMPSPQPLRSRGEVPVSTAGPADPIVPSNGLRRTPGDALVPVLPSSSEGTPPQADYGKTIILVR